MQTEDLPQNEQDQLGRILRMIFEEFDRTLATATQPWKKRGRILKVLLCPGSATSSPQGYLSSRRTFELLIVVSDRRLTEFVDFWSPVEDRLFRELKIHSTLESNVALLVHSLAEVNQQLTHGTPFFVNLIGNGVTLYDYDGAGFVPPQRLPEAEAHSAAQRYFEFWFPLSLNARELAQRSLERGVVRDAAFLLHQSVERAYHCVLCVLTLHSPKTHRIELLRSTSELAAPLLAAAWPDRNDFEKRCFEQLRRSYGEARYSEKFRINEAEIAWIDDRVRMLQDMIRVEVAIQALPALDRDIFRCRRLEAMEYEEIAARFRISVKEVELRISEVLDSLA